MADPFRFAAEGRHVEGVLAVADLARLVDVLADGDGQVVYRIDGSIDENRRPLLVLKARGSLNLRCQRCLGALAWPLAIETALQPVRVGQPIPDEELEDDTVDAIEIEGELDVVALVEDEILLALPIAPRHENCEPPRPDDGAKKESPFAALASLRGSHGAE